MRINVVETAYHRNGISGEGFYVVRFKWRDGRNYRNMVATIFEGRGRLAVLDTDETAKGNIAFAKGNSWRGDYFEPDLRAAICDLKSLAA